MLQIAAIMQQDTNDERGFYLVQLPLQSKLPSKATQPPHTYRRPAAPVNPRPQRGEGGKPERAAERFVQALAAGL